MGRIILADALEGLGLLEAGSCRTCVTFPPYWQLRDYGTPGQIGLEPTPEEYIARLVEVFREVRRVLSDDGTLWVNIADTYAGSRAGKGDTKTDNKLNTRSRIEKSCIVPDGMKPKDIVGIPWMLAFALRDDGWFLRQDIVWNKANCMPESVRDRCTRSHEYIFLLSKQRRYFFDAAAIAETIAESTANDGRFIRGDFTENRPARGFIGRGGKGNGMLKSRKAGYRNKRDVWTIPSSNYSEAHFATFPPDLIRPCILAGSAKGDTVVDPFFGSGTTGVVAFEECRDFVGIDNKPAYVELSERRTAEAMAQGRYENTLMDLMR